MAGTEINKVVVEEVGVEIKAVGVVVKEDGVVVVVPKVVVDGVVVKVRIVTSFVVIFYFYVQCIYLLLLLYITFSHSSGLSVFFCQTQISFGFLA